MSVDLATLFDITTILMIEGGAMSETITADSRLVELGLDSLDLVSVQQAIAYQLGVEVPDDVLERVETVGDLVAAVERGRRHG